MGLAVGDRVCGRYEIRAAVGARPLGMLYRAFDCEIGVEVALRVLTAELLPDAAARQAFVRQLGRARALGHPGLVRLYDVALDADRAVVAVQWASGPTLGEALAQRRADGQPPMSIAEARPILAQVTAAVVHAHGQGVVLGDVRPETVLLLADGVKLTNIGVGPALPRGRYLDALRATRAFVYVAPEIRAGCPAEPRADVYSLAVLAVEMLTGVPPAATTSGTPQSIPGAPPALATVLGRALAAEPLMRQATVDALAHELEVALTGRPRRRSLPPVAVPLAPDPPLPELDPDLDQPTRQIDVEELRQIQGQEVTRQLPADELFSLRMKLSDTQQIDLDAVEAEAELEELPEELELEAAPRDEAEPEHVARGRARPDEDDEEHQLTSRIERIPVELDAEPPPPLMALPPVVAPPPPVVEPARFVAPPPRVEPRRPTPPRVPATAPTEPAIVARPRAAPTRPRLPMALLIGAAAGMLALIVGGMAVHLRTLRHLQQRAEKERLAGELNARAESLRRALAPPQPEIRPSPGGPQTASAPVVAPPVAATPAPVAAPPVAATPAPVAAPPVAAASPAAAAPAPPGDDACPLGARLVDERFCIDVYEYPGGRTIPRTEVSLAEASRLCGLRGERLCTETEWEHACRGKGGASYPYGQSFDPHRCNTRGGEGQIAPAGSFAACRSAAGAYDMSGNVAEWVASGAQRGGSTASGNPDVRCSHAVRHAPVEGGIYVGFRCCADPKR